MITKYITDNLDIISNCKKNIERGQAIFTLIKSIPGLQYLEELLEESFTIECDIWPEYPVLRITKECNLDMVCSVVGEVEAALEAEATIQVDGNDKRVYYHFNNFEDKEIFKITVGHPRCRFVDKKEVVNHYTSKSYERRLVCD